MVDQNALRAELDRDRLRAALDVATPDPLPSEHPLRVLPQLLYTPHVAGATRLALPRVFALVGDQIRRLHAGEPLRNVVVGDHGQVPSTDARGVPGTRGI